MLCVEPADIEHLFARPVGTVFESRAQLELDAARLARLDTVLIDRSSRPEYGNLAYWRSGEPNELNGRRVHIADDIKIGTGFGYNGLLVTSEETLRRALGWPADQITLGLIKVDAGADVEGVVADLTDILPAEVIVLSRKTLTAQEQRFWLTNTAVGQFFIAGVVIALIVGGIFVYQMMAADISKHLPEYATIRAMGYRGAYLSRVVYSQGFLLAVVGYLPGLAVSVLCYEVARRGAGLPIGLTLPRAFGVLALTLTMCLGSALLAVRNVRRANPADLF
jgi:putative ABC transport system permease protein